MKHSHTFTLTLLTLTILLTSGISTSSGITLNQAQNGNVDYSNDNINFRISGSDNVAKYQFWETGDSRTKYLVSFSQMFEAVDSNGNGVYDLGSDSKVSGSSESLSSGVWEISDTTEENGQITFNMTTTSFGYQLTFLNHIEDDASSLKFDIIINGYEFTSSDENVMLVLGFSLSSAGHNGDNNETDEESNNRAQFGDDGFFEVEETATDANGDRNVGFSTGNQGKSSHGFVAYEKFEGELVHDPIIGLDTSNTLLLVSGGVIIIVVVALIVYRQKTKEIVE